MCGHANVCHQKHHMSEHSIIATNREFPAVADCFKHWPIVAIVHSFVICADTKWPEAQLLHIHTPIRFGSIPNGAVNTAVWLNVRYDNWDNQRCPQNKRNLCVSQTSLEGEHFYSFLFLQHLFNPSSANWSGQETHFIRVNECSEILRRTQRGITIREFRLLVFFFLVNEQLIRNHYILLKIINTCRMSLKLMNAKWNLIEYKTSTVFLFVYSSYYYSVLKSVYRNVSVWIYFECVKWRNACHI